jgi:nucleoside-diphosphate-sugar epimerase
MRIFLAGATGVIGRRLLPLLIEHGHEVTALTRQPGEVPRLRALGAAAVVGDVLDRDAVLRAVRSAVPEVVLHQLTDLRDQNFEANSELRKTGTRHLVDAALAAGARRVVAQSIAWAYQAGDVPAAEGTPLDLTASGSRLRTVRGVAALEAAVRSAPEWVLLRYGLLYGPGTWYASNGLMAARARRGELAADGDVSSFVHVGDAARAAVAALDWPPGAVNVCDDLPAAASDWVPVFGRAVGAPAAPVSVPEAERHRWARGASNAHARKDLSWTPAHPSWRAGFAAL